VIFTIQSFTAARQLTPYPPPTRRAANTPATLSNRARARFGTVPSSHLGGIGLDLVLTALAANDEPDLGGGSVAERHRRAGLGFH
jgi:hypothetical protein